MLLSLLLTLLWPLACDAPAPPPAPAPAAKSAKPAPKPTPTAAPAPTPAPAAGPRLASDGTTDIPAGGCEKDGVVYEADGAVYGCVGGGNWCANTPRNPKACK